MTGKSSIQSASASVRASIRSMTGYAQLLAAAKQASEGAADVPGFSITLKSVNHRFLDLHFRMPSGADGLEIKLRRLFKEKIARGHIEVTLTIEQSGANGALFNREVVGNYVRAFRAAAEEFGVSGAPDVNAALRMPGAMSGGSGEIGEALEAEILSQVDAAIAKLNTMREQEGAAIAAELRERTARLSAATEQVAAMREQIVGALNERIRSRMSELLKGASVDGDRVLQEAAMMAERSDVQEELARLRSHIQHFLSLLDQGGEVGKKLDFLLQEFNREANTMLSKTSGISGDAIRITELGLLMKSEIEKLREQVQNLE